MASGILDDICVEPWHDGIVSRAIVDPSLDQMIDIDLSWENVQTAVGNIIAQIGGYMSLLVDKDNPAWRVLNILPILGAQPTDAGTASPVLPQ